MKFKDDRITVAMMLTADDIYRSDVLGYKASRARAHRVTVMQIIMQIIAVAALLAAVHFGLIANARPLILFIFISFIFLFILTLIGEKKIRRGTFSPTLTVAEFCRKGFFVGDANDSYFTDYSKVTKCVEYSDCIFIHYFISPKKLHGTSIPARFLDHEKAQELLDLLREKCPFEQKERLITYETAEAVELPERLKAGEPLYEFEFVPTAQETEKAARLTFPEDEGTVRRKLRTTVITTLAVAAALTALILLTADRPLDSIPLVIGLDIFILVMGWVPTSTRIDKLKKQKAYIDAMRDDVRYGVRVALFENELVTRHMGCEYADSCHTLSVYKLPEGDLRIMLKDADRYHVLIPERVISEHRQFSGMLVERIAVSAPVLHDNVPMRPADLSKGRDLLTTKHGDKNIRIRRLYGVTELVIDGSVYAEQRGVIEVEYTIGAVVDGVCYSVQQSATGRISLYADGMLLGSNVRLA